MQMRMAAMAGLILAGSQVVFGQTVSVGTSSSATSGTTTTVTIPVTVTTPAVTTTAAGSGAKALLDVAAGTGDGSSAGQTLGQSFMTITLSTVLTDTANGWNAQTGTYTVPVTGTYLVTSKMRLMDGTTTGTSYGVGASTTNSDGFFFLWGTTIGLRNCLINTRMEKLNQGDQLRMFSYVDNASGARLNSAELIVEQVQ